MAESEPKPKLIELVAAGAGQGWKAVLKNGKPAVVHEIPVPPAEAAAAIPRIQRLAEHQHPALSPVLAWGTDPNGIWVAVEPNEGTPLSTLLSPGPLTPPAAAAPGAAGGGRRQPTLPRRGGGGRMPGGPAFVPKEAAPPAPAPAPFVAAVPRDETPIRASVSYDAPPRAMQTYPSIPAPTFSPTPAPPPPPAPAAPPPEPRPTPTWSPAPPGSPAPYHPPPPPPQVT